MVRLVVVTREGEEAVLLAEVGLSVMEVMRANDVEQLLALCGGCCACATCHVYVDPEFAEKLPEMGESEKDLLDCSDHRNHRSRLSCQLKITEELDGLRVVIAPED
jgi:2Fe-2S ferredoxin